MAKFCTKCGTRNDDDDIFCVGCGNPLKEVPQAQPEVSATEEITEQKPQATPVQSEGASGKQNGIAVFKRRVGICILLSIVTFGIYAIYWQYLLVKNVRAIKGDDSNCTGEMLCLLFVPFYSLYWWFTRGDAVKKHLSDNCKFSSSSGALYLVLAIFGLSIVAAAIMQNDFNTLTNAAERKHASHASKPFAIVAGVLFLLSSWIFIPGFFYRFITIPEVITEALSILSFVVASIGFFKRDKRIVIIAFSALAFVTFIGIVFERSAYENNRYFIQATAQGIAFLIPAALFAGIVYLSTKRIVGKAYIIPWIIQLLLSIFHAITNAVIIYSEQVLEYNNYQEYSYYYHAPSFANAFFDYMFISLLVFILPIIGYVFAGKWLMAEEKNAAVGTEIAESNEPDENTIA